MSSAPSSLRLYDLSAASADDLKILRQWSESYRPPKNGTYITHLSLGAITLMGSTIAFLGKTSKMTNDSQNGLVVENITIEPSLFAKWTTVQKCIFVAALFFVAISMLAHYILEERLATQQGIQAICTLKLKKNELTVIKESKDSYYIFKKNEGILEVNRTLGEIFLILYKDNPNMVPFEKILRSEN